MDADFHDFRDDNQPRNKKDADSTPRLAESRFVASTLSGQTNLLGRQRLGWSRKIEIEAKKAY
jgi:hypothetical protein